MSLVNIRGDRWWSLAVAGWQNLIMLLTIGSKKLIIMLNGQWSHMLSVLLKKSFLLARSLLLYIVYKNCCRIWNGNLILDARVAKFRSYVDILILWDFRPTDKRDFHVICFHM